MEPTPFYMQRKAGSGNRGRVMVPPARWGLGAFALLTFLGMHWWGGCLQLSIMEAKSIDKESLILYFVYNYLLGEEREVVLHVCYLAEGKLWEERQRKASLRLAISITK